jgi:hypothetical protein
MGAGDGVEEVLDEEFVLPVIAEVVGVAEASTDVDELVERDLALIGEVQLEVGITRSELLAKGEGSRW